MRTILLSLFGLIIATVLGCTSWSPTPRGDLLFSYRVTEGAFHGPPKHDIGTYFFWDKSAGIVTGYRHRAGHRADVIASSAAESEMLLRKISEVGFEPFDYEKEAKTLEDTWRETFLHVPRVLTPDGTGFEIKFVANGTQFSMTRTNPRHEIDFYARYSPKMAKLKAIIDLFVERSGNATFEMMN